MEMDNDFWLQKGDRVCHIKEPEISGTILEIDLDCYPLHEYGVTTARVRWDDDEGEYPLSEYDIQWTNKLMKIEAD